MKLYGGLLALGCIAAISQAAPSRIVGGEDAPNHNYPYQVSFQQPLGRHFCSGSILNDQWVLTAAHCVQTRHGKNFYIVAGTNYLNQRGDVYEPELSIVHFEYENFYNHDIALLKVESPIKFSEFVQPIGIPFADIEDYNRTAIFSGWGVLSANDGLPPNNLQHIKLNVIPVGQCQKWMESATEKHVCSFTKSGEGICFGDSGGPLVYDNVQVGIASYVKPCGIGYPDVYTRVFSFRKWIKSIIES